MRLLSSLHPRRSLVFPFVVVLAPLLWAVLLEADFDAAAGGADVQRVVLTIAALALSYVVAAVSVAVVEAADAAVPRWFPSLLAPSNGALLLFAAIVVSLSLYILDVPLYPGWFEPVAILVGVLIGWPLYAAVLAMYFVFNTFPGQIPFGVQYLFIGVGIALSTAWTFLLCCWLLSHSFPGVPEPTVR